MNLGPTEMVIILVIILVLFGGAKLPELAKGLGEGIRNFKQASREDKPETLPSGEAATEETKPVIPPTQVK